MARETRVYTVKKLNEKTALATVFSNIRRKRRDEDLVTIAEAFDYLIGLYGSQIATSKKIGLSTEMIRQFLSVLKLPLQVQEFFRAREIDSVDVAKELLALRDKSKQIVAASALVYSPSKDVRDIRRVLKGKDTSIAEAKKMILELKPKGLHIFVVDFDEETYTKIRKEAKAGRMKPPEFLRKIVTDYLKKKPSRK